MSKRRMFLFFVLRYRGDHIVPNFEEIWPSGKPRRQRRGAPSAPTKGIAYIEHAMATGILGEKDKDFTTVGKPKVNNSEFILHQCYDYCNVHGADCKCVVVATD